MYLHLEITKITGVGIFNHIKKQDPSLIYFIIIRTNLISAQRWPEIKKNENRIIPKESIAKPPKITLMFKTTNLVSHRDCIPSSSA